ncbi:MAG: alpha/beta fold hydrolase [Acidimicrobiia bacterium]
MASPGPAAALSDPNQKVRIPVRPSATERFIDLGPNCNSVPMVSRSNSNDPYDPLDPRHIDPARFDVHLAEVNAQRIAYVRENANGGPAVLLVHGWPETMRIWWKVIEPLADAGFDVIVPDLRGFGDSAVSADGIHDVGAHSDDMTALLDHLGVASAILVGGDLGGPIVQDMALGAPARFDRLVLFNTLVPFDRTAMAGLVTRPAREASDYFVRQGTDADALIAELTTATARQRYIATFYTSRFWAHPGAFIHPDDEAPAHRFGGSRLVDFHTEPFRSAEHLRASFGAYESAFITSKRSRPARMETNPDVEVVILHGTSDHVIASGFADMAAIAFPRHIGPFLLPRCGHFVQWEAPQALVSAIEVLGRDRR